MEQLAEKIKESKKAEKAMEKMKAQREKETKIVLRANQASSWTDCQIA